MGGGVRIRLGVVIDVVDGTTVLLDDGGQITWHKRGNLKLGDRVGVAFNYEARIIKFVVKEENIPTTDMTEQPSEEEIIEINTDIAEDSHAYYYRD